MATYACWPLTYRIAYGFWVPKMLFLLLCRYIIVKMQRGHYSLKQCKIDTFNSSLFFVVINVVIDTVISAIFKFWRIEITITLSVVHQLKTVIFTSYDWLHYRNSIFAWLTYVTCHNWLVMLFIGFLWGRLFIAPPLRRYVLHVNADHSQIKPFSTKSHFLCAAKEITAKSFFKHYRATQVFA